jgi:hypothetical protein
LPRLVPELAGRRNYPQSVGVLRDRVRARCRHPERVGLAALEKAGKIAGPAVDLGSISHAKALFVPAPFLLPRVVATLGNLCG